MSRTIHTVSWLLMLSMALAVTPAVEAQGGGKGGGKGGGGKGGGGSSYALTIEFTDTFSQMTGERIERIGSDLAGPYVHGQQEVRAEMDTKVSDPTLKQLNFDTEGTNGAWVREIYFNFADEFMCPEGGCVRPLFGMATQGLGRMMSILDGCLATGNPLHAMSEGDNQACHWKLNGPKTESLEGWQTRFNPEEGPATLVTVTCTGTHSDGKCGQWEVLGGGTDAAATFTLEKNKGKTVKVWQGSYFMPFRFVMERQ